MIGAAGAAAASAAGAGGAKERVWRRAAAALGKLVRTTAFKLSFAYLVVFTVFAFVTLGYVAWSAARVLDDQFVSTIEAEINGLAEQYRTGGLRRLVTVVERRSRTPGASLYLVTTHAGERLAGNVGALPPGVLDRPGQLETEYSRIDEDNEFSKNRAIVRVFMLPGGFRLLVGRDVEERTRLREVIQRAFGYSLLLIGLLGCAGAWFITRRVLKRVDDMTETTRTIMAGDLNGRLKVAGTGDELDRLAENLNAMLDRIGELMAGLREVSDNIAHDLKTPLTRLRNKADEALRLSSSPQELKAALEATIEESDNLIRIFNALLMIARLEAGSARETLADFNAAEAVRDVGRALRGLGRGGGCAAHGRDFGLAAGARQPRASGPGGREPPRQCREIFRARGGRRAGAPGPGRGRRKGRGGRHRSRRPRPRHRRGRPRPRARPLRAPRKLPLAPGLRPRPEPRLRRRPPARRLASPRRQRAGAEGGAGAAARGSGRLGRHPRHCGTTLRRHPRPALHRHSGAAQRNPEPIAANASGEGETGQCQRLWVPGSHLRCAPE